MKGRTWKVALYKATLLNGNQVIVKNNSGEKLSKAMNKEYIKGYSLYKEYPSIQEVDTNIDIDLDKVRTLSDMHDLLVKCQYGRCTI